MNLKFSIFALVLLSTTTTITISMVKGESADEEMLHSLEHLLLLSPDGASPQGNERARHTRVASEELADQPSAPRTAGDDPIKGHMARVPKLVQMMSNFNFTDFANLNTDSLRSGFDPKVGPSFAEPLWEKSLKRLENFAAATRDLKQLSHEVSALFDDNVKILQDMVLHTHTNFVGFYN